MTPKTFDRYRNLLIDKYGLRESVFLDELTKWTRKFGDGDINKADFIWSIFNRLTLDASSNSRSEKALYTTLRPIYMDMWQFLIKEKRDAYHVKKQINFCDLKLAPDDNFFVEAIIIGGCCNECSKDDNLVLSIEEALRRQPIPHRECSRKYGCICCYGFQYVRDQSGRLVQKK